MPQGDEARTWGPPFRDADHTASYFVGINRNKRCIALDLSKPEASAETTQRFPELSILINNLGIYEPKPFDAITDADWQRLFETNVMSGVRLSRHYLPTMVKRGWPSRTCCNGM